MGKLLIIEDVFDVHRHHLGPWLDQLQSDFQFNDAILNVDADRFFDPFDDEDPHEDVRAILVGQSTLSVDYQPPTIKPDVLDDLVYCLRRLVDFNPYVVAYIVDDNGKVTEISIGDLLRQEEYEAYGRSYRNIH